MLDRGSLSSIQPLKHLLFVHLSTTITPSSIILLKNFGSKRRKGKVSSQKGRDRIKEGEILRSYSTYTDQVGYSIINMSTQVVCAACGKGGDNLKVCTSCEQVSYCNAKCRKAHRSKHKKECRQLSAEKHNEESAISSSIDVYAIIEKFSRREISDEELFKDPPPKEDCEICFIPMPSWTKAVYQSCCGKTLCSGCMKTAENEMKKGTMKSCCPFCRVTLPKASNDGVKRIKKRMKLNDAHAFHMLGETYAYGNLGLPQDSTKAFELLLRAADLGSRGALFTSQYI